MNLFGRTEETLSFRSINAIVTSSILEDMPVKSMSQCPMEGKKQTLECPTRKELSSKAIKIHHSFHVNQGGLE